MTCSPDHRRAAVDGDVRPADVGRLVAGQEEDRVRDVLRLAPRGAAARATGSSLRLARPGPCSSGAVCGVSVIAGLTALTRMRCGPPSTTRWLVSASTPPLAAPCAFCGMNQAPREPEIEPMLTIAAAAPRDQVRPRGPGDEEDDVELVADGERPVLVRQLVDRAEPDRRRVVHQHVDPAGELGRLVDPARGRRPRWRGRPARSASIRPPAARTSSTVSCEGPLGAGRSRRRARPRGRRPARSPGRCRRRCR